jgi:hypothetical protein
MNGKHLFDEGPPKMKQSHGESALVLGFKGYALLLEELAQI